eukprot:TRINITY_DN2655_c1_g1_i4.p1 TRINITY_DN2655_c1_g1~~TRINITY_DN2655_c1_g1_i4.p1  ORF type:complete len:593 (-),score=223.24 TRINITY_DN2655_c1_g1_i4:83-1861(-)
MFNKSSSKILKKKFKLKLIQKNLNFKKNNLSSSNNMSSSNKILISLLVAATGGGLLAYTLNKNKVIEKVEPNVVPQSNKQNKIEKTITLNNGRTLNISQDHEDSNASKSNDTSNDASNTIGDQGDQQNTTDNESNNNNVEEKGEDSQPQEQIALSDENKEVQTNDNDNNDENVKSPQDQNNNINNVTVDSNYENNEHKEENIQHNQQTTQDESHLVQQNIESQEDNNSIQVDNNNNIREENKVKIYNWNDMNEEKFKEISREELESMEKSDLLQYLARSIIISEHHANQLTGKIAKDQNEAYELLSQSLYLQLEKQFEEKLASEKKKFRKAEKEILRKKMDVKYDESLKNETLNIKLWYAIRANQKNKERYRVIENLYTQVNRQEQFLNQSVDFAKHLLQSALLLVAINELGDALQNHEPLEPFVHKISSLDLDNENHYISTVLSNFSPRVLEKGTVPDVLLSRRLKKDSKVLRRLALIPEGAGVFWHTYSHVISMFLIPSVGMVSGNSVDSILARTQYLIDHGKLSDALNEVRGLVEKKTSAGNDNIYYNTVISQITQPWYFDVKDRIEAQQASSILRAYAVSSILQMTTF